MDINLVSKQNKVSPVKRKRKRKGLGVGSKLVDFCNYAVGMIKVSTSDFTSALNAVEVLVLILYIFSSSYHRRLTEIWHTAS